MRTDEELEEEARRFLDGIRELCPLDMGIIIIIAQGDAKKRHVFAASNVDTDMSAPMMKLARKQIGL